MVYKSFTKINPKISPQSSTVFLESLESCWWPWGFVFETASFMHAPTLNNMWPNGQRIGPAAKGIPIATTSDRTFIFSDRSERTEHWISRSFDMISSAINAYEIAANLNWNFSIWDLKGQKKQQFYQINPIALFCLAVSPSENSSSSSSSSSKCCCSCSAKMENFYIKI